MKTGLIFVLLLVFATACSAVSPSNNQQSNTDVSEATPIQTIAIITTPFQQPGNTEVYPTETTTTSANEQSNNTTQPLAPDNEAPTQTAMEIKCSDAEAEAIQNNQDLTNAVKCWQDLLTLQPNNFYALDGLSRLSPISATNTKAIDYGKAALLIAPTLHYKISILINIGLQYEGIKDYPSSIDFFNQVIQIAPADDVDAISVYSYLADIYNNHMDNQKSKACEYFTKYIELGTKAKDKSIMDSAGQKKFYCP